MGEPGAESVEVEPTTGRRWTPYRVGCPSGSRAVSSGKARPTATLRRTSGSPSGRRSSRCTGTAPRSAGPGTEAGPPGAEPYGPTAGSAARARRAGAAEPGRGLLRLGQRRPVLARGRACPDGHGGDRRLHRWRAHPAVPGTFLAEDGRFIAHGVRVSGVPAGGTPPVRRYRRG
ncbi:hypothetical protein NKG94_30380 [Micromonospora sp. M12]